VFFMWVDVNEGLDVDIHVGMNHFLLIPS